MVNETKEREKTTEITLGEAITHAPEQAEDANSNYEDKSNDSNSGEGTNASEVEDDDKLLEVCVLFSLHYDFLFLFLFVVVNFISIESNRIC